MSSGAMWSRVLVNFVHAHRMHKSPLEPDLHRALISLLEADRIKELKLLLKWLDIPKNYVAEHRILWRLYLESLIRQECFTQAHYLILKLSPSVVDMSIRHKVVEGLAREKQWTAALSLWCGMAKSSPSVMMTQSIVKALPHPRYAVQAETDARTHLWCESFSNPDSPLWVERSPLTSQLLFQYAVASGRWDTAVNIFTTTSGGKSKLPTTPSAREQLSQHLQGNQWRHWSAIVHLACEGVQEFWLDMASRFPSNPVALFYSGRWKDALLKVSGENDIRSVSEATILPLITAAVRAGSWQCAFMCHHPRHISETFDDLPLNVTLPMMAVFGPKWHDVGVRLIHRLVHDAVWDPENAQKYHQRAANISRLIICEGGDPCIHV
eukprot:PhF_6_TR4437/c0_g1_i1/m.6007